MCQLRCYSMKVTYWNKGDQVRQVDLLSPPLLSYVALFFRSSTFFSNYNYLFEGCPDLSQFNIKVLSEYQYVV